MNIKYRKLVNKHDPISVGWVHEGKDVSLEFTEIITAIFSKK